MFVVRAFVRACLCENDISGEQGSQLEKGLRAFARDSFKMRKDVRCGCCYCFVALVEMMLASWPVRYSNTSNFMWR